MQSGKCMSCIFGYSFIQNSCIRKQTNNQISTKDRNCIDYQLNTCVQCSTRYFVDLESGVCINVNPLCKDYNNQGKCTDCYPGYSLVSGSCVISFFTESNSDKNCKKFSNNVCDECYQGYFYSRQSKICERINPLCKTANI